MAEKNRDPHIVALEAVHAALKDLDAAGRKKVLSSVLALLEIDGLPQPQVRHPGQPVISEERPTPTSSRPVSLVEIIHEKQPGTNAQRIALFAYYREKYESLPRFTREDIKLYFSKAKEAPAANYDRDFVEAVRKGWIHEDGADSYLTSKGVEAIESGFEGERKYSKGRKTLGTAKSIRRRKKPDRSRTRNR
jgi:hypothetical protein